MRELEKPIEPKDLEMNNFVGYMHDMIWAMEKRETQWTEKAWFPHMRKFNWTHVNLIMIMEMIYNYQITKEATNLRSKEVDLTIENIVKVFKLPSTRIITRGKEGYNTTIGKYFIGGEE